MNALLSTLPPATDNPGGVPGLGADPQEIQQDSVNPEGFAPVLAQVHAAASGASAAAPSASLDAENLIRQLQSLPQAGKLLPLLAQVLDRATANGIDPQRVLQRIAVKLQDPGSNFDDNPVAGIAAVLHQMLGETVTPKSPAGADALPLVTAEADNKRADRTRLQLMTRQMGVAEAGEKSSVGEAQRDLNSSGLERARQAQPEPQQDVLAGVMETLKRLTAQGKAAHADTPPRVEPMTLALTSPVAQASTPATSALPTLSLSTPLFQGNWDQALGERIQWMVSQKMQGAQVKLNPAHLGPMEVRIQVQNDQASIQFSSAHSAVREALEAALPRLRELFDTSGVELVNVDVSGQSFSGRPHTHAEEGAPAWGAPVSDAGGGAETVLETPLSRFLEKGRLDLFA